MKEKGASNHTKFHAVVDCYDCYQLKNGKMKAVHRQARTTFYFAAPSSLQSNIKLWLFGQILNEEAKRASKRLLRSAKRRAKERGLTCNIKWQDIYSVWPDDHRCPVSKISLRPQRIGSPNYNRQHSPSLDRIDPREGYVKGNIAIISTGINTIKSSLDKKGLLNFAVWILKELEVDE